MTNSLAAAMHLAITCLSPSGCFTLYEVWRDQRKASRAQTEGLKAPIILLWEKKVQKGFITCSTVGKCELDIVARICLISYNMCDFTHSVHKERMCVFCAYLCLYLCTCTCITSCNCALCTCKKRLYVCLCAVYMCVHVRKGCSWENGGRTTLWSAACDVTF